MLDVHILTLPNRPKDWAEECIRSVEQAAASTKFPVYIHIMDGIYGNLGESRRLGYSKGTAIYVTHVDYDDTVDLNAFSILEDAMSKEIECITTGEKRIYEHMPNPVYCPNEKHHLAVYRRDVIEQMSYASFIHFPDQYLLKSIASEHLPVCVYNHYIRHSSASRELRQKDQKRVDKELCIINSPELLHVELADPLAIQVAQDRLLRGTADGVG